MMKALTISIERVNKAHEVGSLLSQLLDASLDALGAKSGLLALQRGEKDLFGVKISRGIPPAFSQTFHEKLPEGLLLDIARLGNPVHFADKLSDDFSRRLTEQEKSLFRQPGFLSVPIHHKHRTIGMLALFGHPADAEFTEQHLHFLIQLSQHTAVALEKAGIIHPLKRRGQNGH